MVRHSRFYTISRSHNSISNQHLSDHFPFDIPMNTLHYPHSIPAEILSKPTKLSDIEFSLIKEHARQGYEMLKDVESPWPLAEIVRLHHERMDGSGYPRKLKLSRTSIPYLRLRTRRCNKAHFSRIIKLKVRMNLMKLN